MKKVIMGILMSVIICIPGSAQSGIDSREQAEQLLRKGKTQQVTGIIVSSAGFAGVLIGVNSFKTPELSTLTQNVKATAWTILGMGTCLVGIITITSGSKKIKKANLFLNSEYLGLIPQSKSREQLVSVGIRVSF